MRDDLRTPRNWKWGAVPPDTLPLWLADMDLPTSAAIRERLAGLAREAWLGYEMVPGDAALLAALRRWLSARGHPGLDDPLRAVVGPGVLPLLYAAVRTLTEPNDAVAVLTPAYPPFFSAVRDQGRRVREVPLAWGSAGATPDLDALDAAARDGVRAVLVCQPHNPTGRSFTRDELAGIAEVADRHGLVLISDEVWADLWLDGPPPLPCAAASPAAAARTLTITGPCKTYSMAGLPIGAAVSANPALLAPLERVGYGIGHPGQFPLAMWEAGLAEAQGWLDDTRATLRRHRDLVAAAAASWPGVRHVPPQATYLAWLDARGHRLGTRVHEAIRREGRVLLNDGALFGDDAAGCVRLNFATTPEVLGEALHRIGSVLG